ncbi:MAG: TonB-dependent receptor [Methylococcaceae bacterium]|nr:TonB-dependent receptor [Methylococcaceae bacterium]
MTSHAIAPSFPPPITAPMAAVLGLITVSGVPPLAAAEGQPARDLPDMNLEQLMGMEVTSAGRKSQKLSGVTAAVYVITQEDIRRSGATCIAEALRLAPGIQVARIDANKWAITSRGFNGRFANKLLVLMDGRSLYNPNFAGVYWEVQDTVLEDIDRIEVIRGPGASLWGANATNGVINIITKVASQTRGGQISAGGGSQERAFGSLRYGLRLGEDTHGRVYFKGFERERFPHSDAADAVGTDAWQMQRGGFRLDYDSKSGNLLTLQGDAYTGRLHEELGLGAPPPIPAHLHDTAQVSGWNVLGRWKKALSLESEINLQFYYDHAQREEIYLRQVDDILDLDFQHRFVLGEQHDLIWGLGYRYTTDRLSDTGVFRWRDRSRNLQLFSGFFQDEITLVPETLKLTLGTKLEHNDFVGFVVQPSARMSWTPSARQAVWWSISRSLRTPSRTEQDGRFYTSNFLRPNDPLNPIGVPIYLPALGRRDYQAEELVSFELGHRFLPTHNVSLDTTLFYNVYDRLRSYRSGRTSLNNSGSFDQEIGFFNEIRGKTYGAELTAKWNPYPWWTLEAQYAYLRSDLHQRLQPLANASAVEAADPRQQFSLRTGFNLPDNAELDLRLRYVDRITAGLPFVGYGTAIPAYLSLDARLGWRPVPSLELSVIGQNLLDAVHPEFYQESFQGALSEVPRGYYLKAKWQF